MPDNVSHVILEYEVTVEMNTNISQAFLEYEVTVEMNTNVTQLFMEYEVGDTIAPTTSFGPAVSFST